MTLASGDVALIDLGINAVGHEQIGTRPAIVLHTEGNVSLVIPLSGNMTRLRFRGTALIAPDKANGLSKPSVALVFQIRAVDYRRILKRLGTLASKDARAVNKAVRAVTLIK